MTHLAVRTIENIAIIIPNNKRIDASFANQFRDDLLELKSKGHEKIVLDLANVDFIDSSGLGVIMFIAKKMERHENLMICHASPTVLSVLKMARIDIALHVVDSPEQAVESLRSSV